MTCEKSDSRESELKYKIEKIEQYLYRRNVSEAIRNGEEAIGFSKNVLSFFRRYQRTEFLCYLTLFWLGWMVTLISTIVRVKRRVSEKCQFLLIELGFPIVLLITLLKYAGETICLYKIHQVGAKGENCSKIAKRSNSYLYLYLANAMNLFRTNL